MARNGNQTYVVWGPPGTGKTTYLANETSKLLAWAYQVYGGLYKRPVLLCSLTRTAAAELAGGPGGQGAVTGPRTVSELCTAMPFVVWGHVLRPRPIWPTLTTSVPTTNSA